MLKLENDKDVARFLAPYRIDAPGKVSLTDHDPGDTDSLPGDYKGEAQDLLEQVFTQYTVGTPEFFDNVCYGQGWVDDVISRVRKLLPLYPERDTQWRVHLAYWAYSLPSDTEESTIVHKVLRSCHKVCTRLFENAQRSGNVDASYSAADLGVQFTQILQGTIFGMLHEPVATREDLVGPIRAYLEQLQPRA